MWSSRRPASERAVTIVSSSRGWRSTIAAASAPANPAAPRTATLGTEGRPDLGEGSLDRFASASNVLVGQRALGRAELEPQRQRLAALADLLAAVDVEQLHPIEQLPRAAAHGTLHRRRRYVLVDDDSDVLDHRREARHVAIGLRARRELGDQVGVELRGRDRPVEVPCARDAWVQLADPAELPAARGEHRGRAARVETRPLAP